MAPEFTEGGIGGQTRVTDSNGFFNSLHIARRSKMLLKSFKLWSSESAILENFRLWCVILPQKQSVSTKSGQRQIPHMFNFFIDHFIPLKFLNLVLSLLLVSGSSFRDRASFPFLMAVICWASCFFKALDQRRVSVVCLLRKNWTRNFFKFFCRWNWFWCLSAETVVCEQLTSTKCQIRIICDNAFSLNFPTGLMKHLIRNLTHIFIHLDLLFVCRPVSVFILYTWNIFTCYC